MKPTWKFQEDLLTTAKLVGAGRRNTPWDLLILDESADSRYVQQALGSCYGYCISNGRWVSLLDSLNTEQNGLPVSLQSSGMNSGYL